VDSFSWRLSVTCEMGSIFVVFDLPSLELSSKIPFMFEMPSLVELLGIGFMTSFDLPVHFRAAWRYVFVRDAQVKNAVALRGFRNLTYAIPPQADNPSAKSCSDPIRNPYVGQLPEQLDRKAAEFPSHASGYPT
jgi:hypothetical protein